MYGKRKSYGKKGGKRLGGYKYGVKIHKGRKRIKKYGVSRGGIRL